MKESIQYAIQKPPLSLSTPMETVFIQLDMREYIEKFGTEGIDTLEDVLGLEEEWDKLNVKKFHRKKLIAEAHRAVK